MSIKILPFLITIDLHRGSTLCLDLFALVIDELTRHMGRRHMGRSTILHVV